MQEYPETDVERIIGEEIMRAEGTRNWHGPVARTRIMTLLMSRLCAAWSKPRARSVIEAVAAAESNLLYYCSTKECVFAISGDGYDALMKHLLACDEALAGALIAHATWPEQCSIGTADKMCDALESIRENWSLKRQELQAAYRQHKQVRIHSAVFSEIHEALPLGYAVFLTRDEHTELNTQLTRALCRIGEYRELFFAGSGPTPRA